METISKKKWMSIYNSIMEMSQLDASMTTDTILIPVEVMLSGYHEMLAGYDALVCFKKGDRIDEDTICEYII